MYTLTHTYTHTYTHTCCFSGITVFFEETSYNALESAGSLNLQVNATFPDGVPAEAMVTITGFPDASPMNFTISNTNELQLLNFPIGNSDTILNNDLMFDVTLSSFDSNVMVISPDRASVTITDDDGKKSNLSGER